MGTTAEEVFRRLTIGDAGLLAGLDDDDMPRRGVGRLDPRTEALVHIAALIAVDARTISVPLRGTITSRRSTRSSRACRDRSAGLAPRARLLSPQARHRAHVRGAVEGFQPGFEPVTLAPRNGPPIVGVKKNEDLFSVQIMDSRERIQGYDKASLKEMQNNPRSAMPPFGSNRISESDLDDLIRYLQTLRGFDPSVVQ